MEPEAEGQAGGVFITTNSLEVTNGALLDASTFGVGDGGSVTINATDLVKFDGEGQDGIKSSAASIVGSEAVGQAGGVSITTGSLEVTNGAVLSATTFGEGDAGSVTIKATDLVKFDGEGTDGINSGGISGVGSGAVGNAGGVFITTNSLEVTNGAVLSATTFGEGDAGSVTINATDLVKFDGENKDGIPSGASSLVGLDAVGQAGGVSITTKSLEVTNGALLNAGTFGVGDAGSVTITTGSLKVTNGAQLDASTFGVGDGGSVTIHATDWVKFDGENKDGIDTGAFSRVVPDAEGQAGSVSITTNSLEVTNGAQLEASTFGVGDAGSVTIQATDLVKFDGEGTDGIGSGAFSSVATDAEGQAGSVSITTNSLEVTNGAELSASTFGVGDAGSLTITTGSLEVTNGSLISVGTFGVGDAGSVIINATDSVKFDGEGTDGLSSTAISTVGPDAEGQAGGISITTGSLEVTNGAVLNASTLGVGDAGSVTITATDSVKFDGESQDGNNSGAASLVGLGAVGQAGGVSITTNSLEVTNGANLDASTFGEGDAGRVTINATDLVKFDGESQDGDPSGAFSTVQAEAEGQARGVSITTNFLEVTNGAELSSSTFGVGNAGSVTIKATHSVKFDGESQAGNNSEAASGVAPEAVGNAGGVSITTNSLEVTNGSLLTATTLGEGSAGNLTITATESVQISGTEGLFVQATQEGGIAGTLTVETRQMSLSDGAEVSVNSPQGQAGNLNITAQNLSLNQGSITAVTGQEGTDGANIFLNIADSLFLANQSLISANANADADGGNVDIDARFVITSFPSIPNGSDINANAQRGDGGRITLTAEGVFGTEFREAQTVLNDITATSESGDAGIVVINSPNVDPSRGITELAQPVDPSDEIVRACTPTEAGDIGEFTVTGRGGLPASPTDVLSRDTVLEDLGTLAPSPETSDQKETPDSSVPPSSPLVEADGWIVAKNGDIIFTSKAASASPQSDWQSSLNCSTADSN